MLVTSFTVGEARLQAQPQSSVAEKSTETIRIQGIVTERKKYSIRVKQDEQEFDVKLTDGVAIALKMNRPWYDSTLR